jgi:hypothetical protein
MNRWRVIARDESDEVPSLRPQVDGLIFKLGSKLSRDLARPESQLTLTAGGVVVGHDESSCGVQFTSENDAITTCLESEDEADNGETVEESFSEISGQRWRTPGMLNLSVNEESQGIPE